jgi:hypothetical protein
VRSTRLLPSTERFDLGNLALAPVAQASSLAAKEQIPPQQVQGEGDRYG